MLTKAGSFSSTECKEGITKTDDGVVPMEVDAEEAIDVSGGDHDVESILVLLLQYLGGLEEKLEKEAWNMEIDGESDKETSTPAETKKKVEELWCALKVAWETTKPVMSSDPEVKKLAGSVEEVIEANDELTLDIVQTLLSDIAGVLKTLRPVDLDKLLNLLEKLSNEGQIMEGKDVLLFLGATGAGKTTTILHLAGTTFEEVEIDGFDHLQPQVFPDPKLKTFLTSCSTTSVTKSVQCFEVPVGDKAIVLCDVPGIGDTEGAEAEIANGFGMIHAIRQAKTVRPVLVMSKDGMGDRFTAVSDVLDTIAKLLGGQADPQLVEAFAYVFTKYDKSFEEKLCKQFAAKRRQTSKQLLEKGGKPLLGLMDDIIAKTDPKARILSPLEGDAAQALEDLWNSNEGQRLNPKESFSFSVPDSAQDQLRLQLLYSVSNMENALECKRFPSVLRILDQLRRASGLLPEAKAPYKQALKVVTDHLSEKQSHIAAIVSKFENVLEHKTFANDLKQLHTGLGSLVDFEQTRSTFLPNEPSAALVRSNAIETVTTAVRIHLSVDIDVDVFLAQTSVLQDELRRLDLVREVFQEDAEAQTAYNQGVKILVRAAATTVPIAQSCLQAFPDGVERLDELYGCYGQLRACFEGLSVEVGEDIGKEVQSLIGQWHGLLQEVQERVTDSVEEVESFDTEVCQQTEAGAPAPIDVSSLKKDRDLLLTLACASCLRDGLPRPLIEKVKGAATTLECSVKISLEKTVGYLLTALSEKQDLVRISMDACLEEQHRVDELLHIFVHVGSQLQQFQRWSCELETDTFPLWVQWNAIQPDLHKYSADVKASLEKFEKEGQASVSEAKAFLQRLKSEGADAANLLQEVCDESCWAKWEKAQSQQTKQKQLQLKKKKKSSPLASIVSWMGLGSNTSADQEERTELENAVDEILLWFRKRIQLAAKSISSLEHEVHQKFNLPHRLLQQKAGSVSLFVVFLQLLQEGSIFCEAVLGEPGLSADLVGAEVLLARALKAIKCVCEDHLSNHRFGELSSLLAKFKGSSDVDHKMRVFGSMKQTYYVGRNQSDARQRRNTLVETIKAFPTCESLQTSGIKEAMFCIRQMDDVSFVDESKLKTTNELDRLEFYNGLVCQLDKAASAEFLAHHAEQEDTRLQLQTAHETCCRHVRDETKKLFDNLSSLLSRFPEHKSEFCEINVGIGNLGSISRVFSNAEQRIADLSLCLMQNAEHTFSGRLDGFVSSIGEGEVLKPLLLLKKASLEITTWRDIINRAIDKLLVEASNRAANAGKFILDMSEQLKKVDEGDRTLAEQLLSEHDCFAFAVNAAFSQATAQQTIDYVLNGLHLPLAHQLQLKRMYEAFSREYKDIVQAGLRAELANHGDDFLNSLTGEAAVLAADLSMQYEAQLISLTAHVIGFWTVSDAINSSVLVATAPESCESHDSMAFLKKPHAAQVVAIWTLLNYGEPSYQVLQNTMCEVKTGEGKSIVLGVTATILAMMGSEVECICYSKYLSDRDFRDFRRMFISFGCYDSIDYGTVDNLCNKLIGDGREVAKNVLLRKNTKTETPGRAKGLRVLLIDEIDVLFKEDFFGSSYNPCFSCHQELLLKLANFIWTNLKDLGGQVEALSKHSEAREFLSAFPVDAHPMIRRNMEEMVAHATRVRKGKGMDYFVHDDQICYKKFDGMTSATVRGFETMFAYLKEHENGNVSMASMERNISLGIRSGEFSYAELPLNFDAILGVTGTLSGLRQAEKDTLKAMYDLHNFAWIPSVYGANKLQFAGDNSRDVVLCDTSDEHCYEVAAEIERRARPINGRQDIRRPVMVFFRSKAALRDFNKSEHARRLKASYVVQTITEEVDPSEKEGLFRKATEAGVVSLLIRDYGRGTDFKCYDNNVLSAGGVHVVQAFYSTDYSEFVQMKGRTARQGADGSFSMVLSPDDLREDLGITSNDIASMKSQSKLCTFLDVKREQQFQKEHQRLLEKVEAATEMHYRSMAFIEAANTGSRRHETLEFLFEMNGVPVSTKAFASNGMKQKFVQERRDRVQAHVKREREQRQHEQASFADSFADAPSLPLLIEGDTTHYGVLGVSRTATKRDIVRAYRRLALEYHPDRNQAENAAELFRRITEAKEVLLCDARRAAYDRSLDEEEEDGGN